MTGYDPNFLGHNITLPLPGFDHALSGDVLRSESLNDDLYATYPHYTVITDKQRRAPIMAALNVDQNQLLEVTRTDNWRIDSRIGGTFQLNNDYYKFNRWDRGHLAMRSNAAWGNTGREAKRASDETFYYSNASLQHENFNQDEWLELETWVKRLDLDANGKITSFSGPIYGQFSRFVRPDGREPAEVPSAFFKVVCFVNKASGNLDVRAFIMHQDVEALANKTGRNDFNFQRYQVTVSEIEQLTGLEFDDRIYQANPMRFSPSPGARRLNVEDDAVPERREIDGPHEIIDAETPRIPVDDHRVDVFISGAMVNPAGSDRHHEWISLINLTSETVDLRGWQLSDTRRDRLTLNTDVLDSDSLELQPGEAARINPISPLQLGNKGGAIELYRPANGTSSGRRVDRVRYTAEHGSQPNKPVVFGFGAR